MAGRFHQDLVKCVRNRMENLVKIFHSIIVSFSIWTLLILFSSAPTQYNCYILENMHGGLLWLCHHVVALVSMLLLLLLLLLFFAVCWLLFTITLVLF